MDVIRGVEEASQLTKPAARLLEDAMPDTVRAVKGFIENPAMAVRVGRNIDKGTSGVATANVIDSMFSDLRDFPHLGSFDGSIVRIDRSRASEHAVRNLAKVEDLAGAGTFEHRAIMGQVRLQQGAARDADTALRLADVETLKTTSMSGSDVRWSERNRFTVPLQDPDGRAVRIYIDGKSETLLRDGSKVENGRYWSITSPNDLFNYSEGPDGYRSAWDRSGERYSYIHDKPDVLSFVRSGMGELNVGPKGNFLFQKGEQLRATLDVDKGNVLLRNYEGHELKSVYTLPIVRQNVSELSTQELDRIQALGKTANPWIDAFENSPHFKSLLAGDVQGQQKLASQFDYSGPPRRFAIGSLDILTLTPKGWKVSGRRAAGGY